MRRRRYDEYDVPPQVVYVEQPRREGCFSRLFKAVGIIVVALVVFAVFSAKDTNSATDKPSATKAAYVSDGIPGTNAYDIKVGLQEQGFEADDRRKTQEGYVFEGRSTTVDGFYQYFILADDTIGANYEIRYAYFSFSGKNNNFLESCIDMSIGNGTRSTAMKSIKNLNEYGESKTNGTTYYYAPVGDNGGILEIASRSHENLIMRED